MVLLLLRLYRKERELPFIFVVLSKTPEQETAGRCYLTNAVSMLKACDFLCSASPNPGACTGSPRGVLKESSKVRGDSSARARVSFVKVHVSSILHIGISWCLTNAKMIFLSLLNSIWLSYCINLDKRKYSENVHHYKNDDCINIIHFGSKHFTSHRALQA